MDWDTLKNPIYEKWRNHWFKIHPSDVAEYSWNYLFTGGKQIRPNLFCELWHYLSPDSTINVELAFAIEIIHVASMILDDSPWMDNATQRRGKQTLHTVFTPKKSLLITYELLQMVDTIWKSNKPLSISEEKWKELLKSKLQRLTLGQYYDIEKKGSLIELASLKTGALFELVTETVAICVELDSDYWKMIGNYMGIIFQFVDDYHDREEDYIQQNRNAFLESYEETIGLYSYLWFKIQSGLGLSFFQKPFGVWMKDYFTKSFPIQLYEKVETLEEKISISYSVGIEFPKIENKVKTFENMTSTDILYRLWSLKEFPKIEQNYWEIEEEKWDKIQEIKDLLFV